MPYALTADELAAGDAVTANLEKMWGWFLAGGIVSVIFGFLVISYHEVSVYVVVYFASAYFIAVGIFQIVLSFRLLKHRWLYAVVGVLWIAAGVIGFVWPHITLYIIAILIGWSFLVFGVVDIVHSLERRQTPHWWIYLIRGIASVVIAFLVLRHPGGTLTALVILLGAWAILFGVIEIIGAFSARHAVRDWEALKAQQP
ncbi:MAG: HdeD family acid-resistance protein [Acidimicrobiales bacterium]